MPGYDFIKRNEVQSYLEDLLSRTAEATGTTKEEIRSRNREPDLVDIRGAFCYAARSAGISSQKIGECIDRTHASVLSAVGRTRNLIEIGDKRIIGILNLLKNEGAKSR